MITKICKSCLVEKPIDCFHEHPSCLNRRGSCKSCAVKRAINWTARNKTKRANWLTRYKTTNRFRILRKDQAQRYDTKYPLKKKAVQKLNNSLRDGKITKKPCAVCGAIKVQAHHDDYSKPLEVRWLCDKHHKEFHRSKSNLQPQ